MKFEDIENADEIYLYLGDMEQQRRDATKKDWVGLSLNKSDGTHIHHDVTYRIPLKDDSVDIVQAEDVMEHIEYAQLCACINDIHRILKPGGLFRLSMPDYNCDILRDRSLKDPEGRIVFDAGGGGRFDVDTQSVVNGGHMWFPSYPTVRSLLGSTSFPLDNCHFKHYYDNGFPVTNEIDYSLGWISRTPDHDARVQSPFRPMSIVIDCYK